jgi:hypothetical protein
LLGWINLLSGQGEYIVATGRSRVFTGALGQSLWQMPAVAANHKLLPEAAPPAHNFLSLDLTASIPAPPAPNSIRQSAAVAARGRPQSCRS